MTPEDLWKITDSLEIRFISDPSPLLFLSISSLLFIQYSQFVVGGLMDLKVWIQSGIMGWPILAFTFYEGIICAFLRDRNGLLSAALGHGIGIFLMSSGFLR